MVSAVFYASYPAQGFMLSTPIHRKVARISGNYRNKGFPASLLRSDDKIQIQRQSTTQPRSIYPVMSQNRIEPESQAENMKPRSAVAVAGCRLLPSGETEWLLIKRGKPPSYGEWSLPGGSVELGESTIAAARRELCEETRLSSNDVKFFEDSFMTSDAIVKDARSDVTLFHYVIAQLFAEIKPEAQVVAGDDALDVGWFTKEKIRESSFGAVCPTKSVLRARLALTPVARYPRGC
uniref:Nudix hydrolase domain-containing protein n=1 Tax=Guillardia theta TaxID=55529 RepID=A0A7S4KV36_GUITH